MSDDWKKSVDINAILRRHQQQEDERIKREKKEAEERKNARIHWEFRREYQRLIRIHQNKFRCADCGKPSVGPELTSSEGKTPNYPSTFSLNREGIRSTGDSWILKYDNWWEDPINFNWDMPKGNGSCSVCHKYLCNECPTNCCMVCHERACLNDILIVRKPEGRYDLEIGICRKCGGL